jgi:DNA-directed RNA polymerase
MTLPYGVTFYGVKQQLIEDNKQDNPQFFGNLSAGKAAEYLASKIMEAMSMHIRGAVEGMQWLQEIASIVGPSEISWFTPDNFYVIQSYKTVSKTRIETIFGKKVVRLWFVEPTTKINVSKQKGGIAPNFIHSLDATHLRMVASEFLDDNRSLGVIHDSFSTHSCDIPELSRVIRDKFYELHSNDIMRDFKEQIEQQIQKKLPEPPEKGDYNLQEIYQSDYFFS